MINKEEIIGQCRKSYGKNVRLRHLQKCIESKKFNKAVEFGCGPAWLLHNLTAREKIGYDLNPLPVFRDIKYVKKDINNISEVNIDFLICSEVIEHVKNDKKSLEIFYDFMNERAYIFLTTVNKNTKKDKSEQDKLRGHLRRYSKDLKDLLESVGFETLKFYPAKSQYYYRNNGDIDNYSCEEDIKESVKSEDASMWVYLGRKKK